MRRLAIMCYTGPDIEEKSCNTDHTAIVNEYRIGELFRKTYCPVALVCAISLQPTILTGIGSSPELMNMKWMLPWTRYQSI